MIVGRSRFNDCIVDDSILASRIREPSCLAIFSRACSGIHFPPLSYPLKRLGMPLGRVLIWLRQLRDLLLARRHLFSRSKLLRETALTVCVPLAAACAASLPRLLKEVGRIKKENGVYLLLIGASRFPPRLGGWAASVNAAHKRCGVNQR